MPELAINIATKYNASGATAAKRDLNALQQASQGVKGAFANLQQSLAGGIQSVGAFGNALLPLSAGLAAIGVSGLKSMAEFSQTMENTRVIVNATEADMAALTQQALDLGAASVFSANEVAAAQRELGKAGLSTNEIMGALPGVLNLAAAGQVDMATAASLTTSALNSFGLEVEESARVADLLAGAANASLADITDLGQGMQQAGFAFAEANWPIEDLATSLAILTDRGLTGSDAGTALKNAWTRMVAPTKEAKGVMDELGISFFTATGNMKSLPEIIDNLNMATAGLTEEQRANLLSTIFLSDGYKALAPLLDEGVAGFNEYKEVVTEAGAAQKVAEANMKGLAGAIEYIMGSIDSAMKAAFLPWEEVIADTIISIADLVSSVGDLPDPILKAAVAFAAVLAVAGPLAAALPFVAAAFGALLSPIGLVVLAIAGLAAAWAADLGNIQEVTASIVGRVRELLSGLWTGITTGNWQPLLDSLATLRADLSAWFTGMKASIGAWVKDWWNQFAGTNIDTDGFMTGVESLGIKLQIWFAIQKTKIAGWVKEWATGFSDWVSEVWPTLSTNLDALITSLSSWIGAQADVIYANVSAWATEFSDWVVTVWPILSANLLSLVTSLTGWIGSQAPVIGAKVEGWATELTDWVDGAWTTLSPKLTTLADSIGSWADAQTDVIYAKVSGWFSQFAESEIGGALITAVESLITDITAKFDAAKTAIMNLFGGGEGGEGSITIGDWTIDLSIDTLKTKLTTAITNGLNSMTLEGAFSLAGFAGGVIALLNTTTPAGGAIALAGFAGTLIQLLNTTTIDSGITLGGLVGKIVDALNTFDFAGAGVTLGDMAGNFLKRFGEELGTVDWGKASGALGNIAAALVGALGSKKLWTGAGVALDGIISSLASALGDQKLWVAAGTGIGNIVNGIAIALAGEDWVPVGAAIATGIAAGIGAAIATIDWIGLIKGSLFGQMGANIPGGTPFSNLMGVEPGEPWDLTPTEPIEIPVVPDWTEGGWSSLESSIPSQPMDVPVAPEIDPQVLDLLDFMEGTGPIKIPVVPEIKDSTRISIDDFLPDESKIITVTPRIDDTVDIAAILTGGQPFDVPIKPVLSTGTAGGGYLSPEIMSLFADTEPVEVPATLKPEILDLLDFMEGIEPPSIDVELEPTGFKGGKGGLASMIPPDQRVLEVEIEPQTKGGGLISSLKDLIPSLDTIGAEFEIPEPKWLSSLVDWNAEEPSWLSSLLDWIPDEPPWQNALLSWVPDEPPWQSSLLNWIAKTPPWHSPLLNWVAKTPPWVPQLTSWVAPTPGWVPALLSYTLPRPTWWGTEAGYIQKPSWWGSSAGTITNVTRIETVASGGSNTVRSAARATGQR